MSLKYCLPVPDFFFWPKLTHPAARSLCDSWASCYFFIQIKIFCTACTVYCICCTSRKKTYSALNSLSHGNSNNRVGLGDFSIFHCEWENKLKLNHVHEQHKSAINFSSQGQRSRSYMTTFIGLIEPRYISCRTRQMSYLNYEIALKVRDHGQIPPKSNFYGSQ